MFTKYGYSTLGIISILVVCIIALSFFVHNGYFKSVMIILPALLMVFSLYFFRDPDRISPRNEKAVLSPADGRVLFVKDVFETKFIKGKAKQVSIFMSPLSVHVNRIPIDGKIEFLKYHEGKYYAAFKDKASEMNERAEFGIVNKYGKIFFTQVAGFIARRIIYEVELGDTVKAGERFGMIKFGSRVDVVVPSSWRANVQKDDDVKAGESILFEFVED